MTKNKNYQIESLKIGFQFDMLIESNWLENFRIAWYKKNKLIESKENYDVMFEEATKEYIKLKHKARKSNGHILTKSDKSLIKSLVNSGFSYEQAFTNPRLQKR